MKAFKKTLKEVFTDTLIGGRLTQSMVVRLYMGRTFPRDCVLVQLPCESKEIGGLGQFRESSWSEGGFHLDFSDYLYGRYP